ncbi:MAG: 3-oxoacyl-ACP synthase III [Pirellulales bacterium]|nr:3-oxoacyl-ACP synthase III [Pirellulales bacterium]
MQFRYQDVCLEAIACTVPDEIVTSEEIEARLAPLYSRLRLPEGRLELMSGIRQRRLWPQGMLPGEKSVETADKAIRAAGIDRRDVGALVHGSVCRDYLEPATASGVHHGLALSADCLIYDVSNACLGLLNGMVQVANMIELGQICAGVVVGTESARALVETTIDQLNRDESLSRNDIKTAVASLTIGSGSAAIVLVHRDLSRTGNRLLGGVVRAATEHCHLCRSGRDESAGEAMRPLMSTDSETLMREGIEAATDAFDEFLETLGWSTETLNKTFCHQVGKAHRQLMLSRLGLEPAMDYATLDWLGNTGSVALPMTAALGLEAGHVAPNDRVGLLGIGSGINVVMLGAEFQTVPQANTADLATADAPGASASRSGCA